MVTGDLSQVNIIHYFYIKTFRVDKYTIGKLFLQYCGSNLYIWQNFLAQKCDNYAIERESNTEKKQKESVLV